MIEHLRGREQALAPLGWTGREAEWIALVCLHSGVFNPGSILSLLRCAPDHGVSIRQVIGGAKIGGGE